MPVDVPIACTLAEAELPKRLADASALGAEALIGLELSGQDAVLRFDGELDRVQALVAAERGCCSFLEFEIKQPADAVELSIHTPQGGEPILRSLVAAVVAGWEGGL